MNTGDLGKIYPDGAVIVRQDESGECMYVVQAGEVEVIREQDGTSVCLHKLAVGDFFGEMALFEREVRSASVRARGEARVLTLDKKIFLRRVHADPSLAYRLLQTMCQRIRRLNAELLRLQAELEPSARNRPSL